MSVEITETYSGTWWSTEYLPIFSKGNVWVDLKDYSYDKPYTVEAKIKYTGMYRAQQEETLSLTVRPSQDSAETKSFVTPETSIDSHHVSRTEGKLNFHITERSKDEVKGIYTLSQPKDKGEFHLKKGTNHINNCCVM